MLLLLIINVVIDIVISEAVFNITSQAPITQTNDPIVS